MMTNHDTRRFAPPAWVVAWSSCLVFLVLAFCLAEPPHHLRYARIENRHGIPLWVVVYFPDPPLFARAPAAVICQPFNSAPEYGRLLALELVRSGFVVLTFDWRGRTRQENRQLMGSGAREVLRADAAAAVAYLRRLREVDPARIVIAGHSVGGTLAIEAAADDPSIAAVASIGMEADVAPDRPRNLLWAAGLYDEFRVLNRMRDVFQASASTAALEETTVGDFTRGTARRLGVSPSADHFTELQDREIHREVVEWFRQAVGLPRSPQRFWLEARSLLILLAGFAGLLAALATLRRVAGGRRWVMRVAAAIALLGVVLLSLGSGPRFLAATNVTLWLTIFVLLAGFVALRESAALQKGWRFAARAGVVVWVSVFLTFVVNNVANYVHQPRYLLWLPEFALRHVLDGLYAYLVVASRPFLFSVYNPETLIPRLWVYAVFGLEILFPGLLLGAVARLARRGAAPVSTRRQPPLVTAGVLLLLVGFLVGVTWLRIQQGFLTVDSALAALRFLLRFTVLPILIFSLLWRRVKHGRLAALGRA
jgi:dienelactone hydrolase